MRREVLLVAEMIDAANEAIRLIANIGAEDLRNDRQRRDALLWNFTVIGEASNQLDDAIKNDFPEIPWARPVQLRNRIIHGYWSVDMEILHTTATTSLPTLVVQLQALLEAITDDK